MGNITFSKDELDIINSIDDPKTKADVVKEFLHTKISLQQLENERSEKIKSVGEKALDFLNNLVNNIAENSDKIIDVINYAKTVKDDYDRKYHPEKINQKDVSTQESQEMQITEDFLHS